MVLGDELHTGGKALESNVLSKRLEFFKSLGEHIQSIGRRIIAQAVIFDGGTGSTVYTVPDNVIFWLFYLHYSVTHEAVSGASYVCQFTPAAVNQNIIFTIQSSGSEVHVSNPIIFPIPIKLNPNEAIHMNKTSNVNDTLMRISILGYEVPKEISL